MPNPNTPSAGQAVQSARTFLETLIDLVSQADYAYEEQEDNDAFLRLGKKLAGWKYDGTFASYLDELTAALSTTPGPAPVEAGVGVPRLTDAMIRAACKAFYKTDNIDGVSLAFRGADHTFRAAFKRMWNGAIAAAPPVTKAEKVTGAAELLERIESGDFVFRIVVSALSDAEMSAEEQSVLKRALLLAASPPPAPLTPSGASVEAVAWHCEIDVSGSGDWRPHVTLAKPTTCAALRNVQALTQAPTQGDGARRQFLATEDGEFNGNTVEEPPCPVRGREERGQGGYLSCECPAPAGLELKPNSSATSGKGLPNDPDNDPKKENIIESVGAVHERAAKIARDFSTSAHIAHSIKTGCFPEQSDLRDAIADAILEGGHAKG